MYKLISNKQWDGSDTCSLVKRLLDNAFIPFDPANTDYQTFKYQINHDEAQLEDADGNLMTPEQAKAYIKELP